VQYGSKVETSHAGSWDWLYALLMPISFLLSDFHRLKDRGVARNSLKDNRGSRKIKIPNGCPETGSGGVRKKSSSMMRDMRSCSPWLRHMQWLCKEMISNACTFFSDPIVCYTVSPHSSISVDTRRMSINSQVFFSSRTKTRKRAGSQ